MKTILFQGAWPAKPIDQYRRIDDDPWGYLIIYSDGDFVFDDSRTPTLEEIYQQWPQFEDRVALTPETAKPTRRKLEKNPLSECA